MRLQDISGRDLVVLDLEAELRTDALRELIEVIARKKGYNGLQKEEYLSEILQRHEKTPSGLGRGLAFPNARIADLEHPTLAIGFSKRGFNFQARDGMPAHVILLYLGRSNPPAEEKRMLSRLSLALGDSKTAEVFMAASSVDDVWQAVMAIDAKDPAAVT